MASERRLDALAVLTRPAGRNEMLAARLQESGIETLIAPALAISMLPTERPRPDAGTLCVFVSRQAVDAYFGGASRPWPPGAWAAAVGAATAQALAEHVPKDRVIFPSAAGAPDSEALLAELDTRRLPPARACILRAQTGREWLAHALEARGWSVSRHALYARRFTSWDRATCERFVGARHPVLLLTSSACCDAISASLARQGVAWPLHLSVVTLHARIARRLQCCYAALAASRPEIHLSAPDEASLFQAILAAAHDRF